MDIELVGERLIGMQPSPLTPTIQRGMGEDAAERLREAIQRGYFAPGQRLRAEQLATMLGMTRGPVREALMQLEREGLVLIRRHRGAEVARLSRKEADEVYSLRYALEQFAIQCAVRQGTPEDFDAMAELLAAFAQATTLGSAG